jgi:3-deoxy-D-manno-octulosonic-acid transferase
MPLLLNTLYLLLLVAVSPLLLWQTWRRGKRRPGFAARFWGRAPRRLGNRPCIWFHAVSLGEVKQLRPVVDELARRRPDWDVFLSTSTATGLAAARREFPEVVVFFSPLDFSWAVNKAVARIRPTVLALVELELWPNLIHSAKKSGARVVVLNARLGQSSFRGYSQIRWALAPTFRRLDLVAAQTEEYAARFVALGAELGRVRVTGSIKYDNLETDRANPRTVALRRALGVSGADVVFVAGSTMEGEEAAALEAFRAARASHPRLRLILVPRHPERFDAVATWLASQGESFIRRSRQGALDTSRAARPIILLDTVGELSAVWGLADVAFVGGSLFPGRGGQNMMEPAAYAAAVCFGPHTHNFRDAVEGLLACNGARRISSTAGLVHSLRADLDDPDSATRRALAGRDFVLAQHGAATRTINELDRLVQTSPSRRLVAAI